MSNATGAAQAPPQQQAAPTQPHPSKIRKRRPFERDLPPKIEELLEESKIYAHLQAVEKRLDATLTRKKLEWQESIINKPQRQKRTLRLFISNLAGDQVWQQRLQHEQEARLRGRDKPTTPFKVATDRIPNWTLKLEGKLLEQNAGRTTSAVPKLPPKRFTSFFKAIFIELQRDPHVYPTGNLIEFKPSTQTTPTDGIECKRAGDTAVQAKIILFPDHVPDRFKLSETLAQLLGVEEETKSNVILYLWKYIKLHKLQSINDRRMIKCDEHMAKICGGKETIMMYELPSLLQSHLSPVDPIVIDYTIQVHQGFTTSRYVYDIEVEIEDAIRQKMQNVVNAGISRDISALEDQITQQLNAISMHSQKRDFFLGFSKDPVTYIQRWNYCQARDLGIVMGMDSPLDDAAGGPLVNMEQTRRADFYKQNWVHEGVFHYLNGAVGP